MPNRYKVQSSSLLPVFKLRLGTALREVIKRGYHLSDLRSDLLAGLVVAFVAIPLGMALAIASGVAPQYGLYTVIIGGSVVALFGGSQFQVTGPTAAFVVILSPVVHRFGFSGLLIAGLIAGFILIFMGLARLGRLIQFIPYPVTTGFTSGIAVVIAVLQLKDFLGLQVIAMPEHFIEKIVVLFHSLGTASFPECAVGLMTLVLLILWPKLNKNIPAPLVALTFVTLGVVLIHFIYPSFTVATLGSRFSFIINGVKGFGIPQVLPHLHWPWNYVSSGEHPFVFSLKTIEALIPSAFAIAMLGAIESLLSAVVADAMVQTKHNPDSELVALGIGNVFCPFFGGIPATGAIARTITNIRFGARSPFSAIFHSVFTLLIILLFAPYVSYLPMAALAALLILVAYHMAESKHFMHILKVAPRSDVIVLLLCFSLTILFDMIIGVTVGIVLAALLFMRRMAEVTEGHKVVSDSQMHLNKPLPHGVLLYEIEGPLFFGAAEKAAEALTDITDHVRGVIFLMERVPTMDVTGLVAFESALKKLCNGKRKICLLGLRSQPQYLIFKSGLTRTQKSVFVVENIEKALEIIS